MSNMTQGPAVRVGLIVGVFLLFIIIIGLYGTFESLTLSGMWLTAIGATASEILAQKPSLTNPQFSRVLLGFFAVLLGFLLARRTRSFAQAVVAAVVANAVAGAMVGIFVFAADSLYDAGVDVRFVLEKISQALVASLTFGQSNTVLVVVIYVLAMAGLGIVGVLLSRVWSFLNVRRTLSQVQARSNIPAVVYRNLLLLLIFLFLIAAPLRLGIYWNQVLGSIGLFVLLGLGLNIVVGFAGLLDLGYVGFYAIGAYTVAVLTAPAFPFKIGFWPALPLAMIAAAVAGVILGIPVLRLRGDYLAIVTLGFGEIIRILYKFNPLTGGPQGVLNVGAPTFEIPLTGIKLGFESSTPYYYLILVACVVVAVIAARINSSRTGRAWTAMREDEDAAEATGIDTVRVKLLAFGMGALFAGLGGTIYAARQQHVFPDDFTLLVSINALALIIIGGLGSIPGVIVGSVVLIGLPEILRPVADFRLLFYAALLVVMMLVRPGGLIPSRRRREEVRERDAELEAVEST